jgi:hypothetical protein
VNGRLVVAAVFGVTTAAVTVPGLAGAEVVGGPSLVPDTLGWQLLPVPPLVGVVVPVVPPGVVVGGVDIEAMVVGVVHVAAAAPAVPVNPETMTSEVTAIPDPMINRLAHILVALLFVEAIASAYP